jgi:hypothetical protein
MSLCTSAAYANNTATSAATVKVYKIVKAVIHGLLAVDSSNQSATVTYAVHGQEGGMESAPIQEKTSQ